MCCYYIIFSGNLPMMFFLKTWVFPQNSSLFMKNNSIFSKMLSSGDDDYYYKIKDISVNSFSVKILAFVIYKFRQPLLYWKKKFVWGKVEIR